MATRVRLTADVDPDVKKRVKVAAVESDLTVSQWIEQALRERLQQRDHSIDADNGRTDVASGMNVPETEASTLDKRGSASTHGALLNAILADRDAFHLPVPGAMPIGSKNPPRLRDGSKISDAVIEDRR